MTISIKPTASETTIQENGSDVFTIDSSGITMAAGKTLPASALTGTLPAISGANLTGLPASGLGVGQTWQNVVGSRAINTTYTNSTGKPIAAHVYCTSVSLNYVLRYIVDGQSMNSDSASGVRGLGAIMIIPDGSTYLVDFAGGGGTLNSWKELKE